jgi:hypothetical protein
MTPLSDDPSENLDRFIVEALQQGCIWGLEGPEGWALTASERYPNSNVMPLWSQREFAQGHCQEEWRIYQPVAIDLEEFLDDWLTGMHNDELLVGVNWNQNLEGEELEPLDLLQEFEQEMAP